MTLYKDVKELRKKNSNIGIEAMPSFCGSDYKRVIDFNTDKEFFILLDEQYRKVIDITEDYDKAVNSGKARRNIDEILCINGY